MKTRLLYSEILKIQFMFQVFYSCNVHSVICFKPSVLGIYDLSESGRFQGVQESNL